MGFTDMKTIQTMQTRLGKKLLCAKGLSLDLHTFLFRKTWCLNLISLFRFLDFDLKDMSAKYLMRFPAKSTVQFENQHK